MWTVIREAAAAVLQIGGYHDPGASRMIVLATLVVLVWAWIVPFVNMKWSRRRQLPGFVTGIALTFLILVGSAIVLPKAKAPVPTQTTTAASAPPVAPPVVLKTPTPRRSVPSPLKIYLGKDPAADETFSVTVNKDGIFSLPELRLQNPPGAPVAREIKVRLFLEHNATSLKPIWQRLSNTEKRGFVVQFFTGSTLSISPGGTQVLPAFIGKFAGTVPASVAARLEVFSTYESPAVADFTIVPQQTTTSFLNGTALASRRAAMYVDKIVKGPSPPIFQSSDPRSSRW